MKGIFLRKKGAALLACLCVIAGCVWHTAGQAQPTLLLPAETVIVLDAGHGGWDPGKTGTAGADEKTLNLAVTAQLQAYLEQGGARVILTRAEDGALGAGKRADMAERQRIVNESGAALLVSIHQNAFPSAAVHGAQVFYYEGSAEGKRLAECVQESLRARVDGSNSRQAKANGAYYMLRKTEIPAVIVECGFLSNAEEERLLNDADYQARLAWAIYGGILDYLGEGTA